MAKNYSEEMPPGLMQGLKKLTNISAQRAPQAAESPKI